ncbi:MAG: DUF3368 domain-containing protein [Candidatus Latescibacteria bacterium]|nr:DUF3368 domain-containing protein [Candidatus Latescibacterota bacterium]
MIVVADAGPLIFLAKIRRLGLVHQLLGDDIRIPRPVRAEVLTPGADPAEIAALEAFLADCLVEPVPRPRSFASAMSSADNAALTLAVRRKADILLCDERVTRMMAETEGIRPLGTLGILLRARRSGLVEPAETRRLVDLLVATHGFRISVEVYQAVLATIES